MDVDGVAPGLAEFEPILRAFSESGQFDAVEEVFDEMLLRGLVPLVAVYNVYVGALCRKGELAGPRRIVECMERAGCPPDVRTFGIVVAGCVSAADVDATREVALEATSRGLRWDSPELIGSLRAGGGHVMARAPPLLLEIFLLGRDGFPDAAGADSGLRGGRCPCSARAGASFAACAWLPLPTDLSSPSCFPYAPDEALPSGSRCRVRQGREAPNPTKPSLPARSLIFQGGARWALLGMDGGGMAPPPTAPEATYISPAPHAAAAGIRIENCYVFKCRLQEYAQKAGLPTPEYHTFKEGPSHEPIFKSTVVINNTKYDSLPGFFNRKAAEQSAAEVALMEIFKSIPTNASIPAVQETGLCKNLLQEYAQKMNYAIPSYISTKQASGVAPFICTVEIGGIQYIGAAARTKKEAEIKAARTALLAIQGQSVGCANGATKYIVVPGKRQGKETLKKPIETPKPLKVKKVGFKKKWNKRKFMKKNGQAVDVEKDETRMVGDVYDADVPMQPTTITQVPSSDIILLQPDEESRRLEQELPRDTAMVQPNEEARSVKQEPPSGTAMLQPDEEASRVELERPRDTATVQPNEEARSVKQEPLSDTAMPQPNGEARRVEPESLSEFATVQPNGEAASMKKDPPSNSAIMRRNNEARTVNQEPPSNASLLQPNNEPIVENSESVYENKNQISVFASLETNKSVGNMPGMGSDPSSTAMSEEQIVVVE